ncbi:MAG: glycosyl transferase, WecB/TagA/CpsF family [Tardiphaga sp.]|nr:glycosyl transferase, WecB/TagA/CpsF family [Tardiphaga sp.]
MLNETDHRSPASDTPDAQRRKFDRRISTFADTKAAFATFKIAERRVSGDRRRSLFQRWRRIVLGGLPVVVVDRQEAAKVIVDEALKRHNLWRYPAYLTSTNGEVTYRCDADQAERSLFLQADAISADGMFHVFVSRFTGEVGLPERVATTDLFYDVALRAQAEGATMFMLGATPAANEAAADAVRSEFPGLRLLGHRHGYFDSPADEIAVCDEIARLAPDILWVSMGVPREQEFVVRNRSRLASVGVIKTSGGLFDFLSGNNVRAPRWMQNAGLEWLWRIYQEPRRLAWRYIKTNPRALYLLLTKSR